MSRMNSRPARLLAASASHPRPVATLASLLACGAVAGAAVAPAATAGTSAAAKPLIVTIQTGTYVAMAGTATFRFKVIAHTATDDCGAHPGARCFIALTYPKLKAPCTNGLAPEDNPFAVPDGSISSSGRFSYHQTMPLISFSAAGKGSAWTGTLREKDSYNTGGGPFTCDTGVVHWSAKLQ